MRLQVLLTNGKRTVDVIWLDHRGADIYYGFIGWKGKTTYHGSGKRHDHLPSGERTEIQSHHPLNAFCGQLQLCAFGISTAALLGSEQATDYTGKKGDSVILMDARALPDQVNVSLGLLEVGAHQSILPVHQVANVRLVHLVTHTVPWIYVMVMGTTVRLNHA